MTPTPPPGSLAKVQRMDVRLGHFGDAIGRAVNHYLHDGLHLSLSNHPAPHLALALILLALCGVILSVPIGVWMYKRRHHLRSSFRGLLSLTVWRERRKWLRNFPHDLDIASHPAPKVLTGWPTRSGATLVLRLDGGMNLDLLQNIDNKVAAQMRCPIHFRPIHHNPGRCYIDLQRRDSLARKVPWPLLNTESVNFLGPIMVAVDTNGQPVTLDLREKNLLVAGIMGSGKSWFLHVLVANAMLDRRVQVHMLDGKMGTGFQVWEPACASFATDDEPKEAIRIVEMLQGKLNKIFDELKASGKRSIDWTKAETVHLLLVDEYTAFLGIPGFEKSLNELVRRGRAGGVIVVLATQRPSAKVMDTDLSRLIEYRFALLCADKDSSKMALGTNSVDASLLSGKNPGEGWLFHEGRQPVRCRGYSLTDRDLASLAARAMALRANSPHETVKLSPEPMPDTPIGSRSSTPPNLSLLPPPSESVSLSRERLSVLAAFAELGPDAEGATVRKALSMSQAAFSGHGRALVAMGYATRVSKPSQAAQFGHGRPPWCWTITPAGNAILSRTDASRNERVVQPKEAGAQ